ncbi:MAG TPA: CheR family methyltransferase [Allocoleopsis sp.]
MISRFYRDRFLFDCLRQQVLPILAQQVREQGKATWIWSAGCASGEEAYTLNILWKSVIQPQFPDVSLHIVTTDVNSQMLKRAGVGCYRPSSLKELLPEYRELAFEEIEQQSCIRPEFQDGIYFMQQDIRTTVPKQTFHLILCRNLVFTYFDESLRQSMLHQIVQQLQPGGLLMLGKHESLPDGFPAVMLYSENLYQSL